MGTNADGSFTVHTLGDHIDEGNDIYVQCDDCQRRTSLNLENLADRLGRDHSALAGDLSPHLKCSRCDSKRMSFTVLVRAGWDGSGGHNNYSKA